MGKEEEERGEQFKLNQVCKEIEEDQISSCNTQQLFYQGGFCRLESWRLPRHYIVFVGLG